ncbi:Regulator of G-protein signaling 12 [Bagarius yarrelli]|uniref:Regulator of G-protein signaling 12 n=1 Tax=Bagarius yarrelli TaxID=175774 RepID=A0A556TMF0_BAGYA|nr:Regulator of G-protein signaling 12 [Bagarius yarrelli]
MFRSSETSRRRANSQARGRVRAVEVARGRTGYGFTLSGHSPCVLSCVLKGSPADYVGLRAGDQILAVNDINVAKASHEDVVKLIGRCSGMLHLLIAESGQLDSCSSDEELGFHEHKSHWLRPKMDSKTMGINRAERVVAEMQSGGIFNMIFENSSSHSSSSSEKAAAKRRPITDLDFLCGDVEVHRSDVNLLSEQEMAKVLQDDSVFVDVFEAEQQEADSSDILNVGMIVGYLGSIELASSGANLESDSVQAIRGCMRRLRAEHKVHSLVLLEVLHDRVLLRNERRAVLAAYPAEKLAFSAVCPDDRRFFGLVTMQAAEEHGIGAIADEDQGSRTSCHVFLVDPELCHHKVHQGISRRFGFSCTPDPDTGGCLEFPPTSQPLLQFVSVLYRDMGESIEGVRARAFLDGDLDAQQNNSTSSNSDSGIGNFLPEEKNNRVLLVDLGANPTRHVPTGLWESTQNCRNPSAQAGLCSSPPPPPPPPTITHRNGYRQEFSEPHPHSHTDPPPLSSRHLSSSSRLDVSGLPTRHHFPAHCKKGAGGQRWLPVHVLKEWHQGRSSDQESYSESTDGWSSANCSTLPPPMSKIPADRYRAARDIASQPHRLHPHKDEWANKLFGTEKHFYEHQQLPQQHNGKRSKESEKKGGRFRGFATGFPQRSSGRRSFGRSKRLSVSHSLDDLELNSADLKGCGSDNSLNSNASLPSVQCHRRHPERRVAAWAVCFERLLQDPVGIRYFSEFLKKEFSEENILFWQACEFFSHVPETDKKQLSQKAREIYNSFLSSKATTPVNIDSQAQLADDILNAPRPDMFKEQQLQIFNLMKFDSYTRFLKSFLYQECMLAEVEGRPLPDPHHIPSSPTSKHSTSSERSNLSTPKKEEKKSKSTKALNEECKDEQGDKKKGSLFPWPRNRSFGKGHKKKDLGEYSFAGNDGRRESQGSLSSGASLELGTSSATGKNEGEVSRNSMSLSERAVRYCNINLPDGSCCSVPIRPAVSIREVLLGLCEKLCINLAAVDLFLVGGEKDCMTLCSRDLRLEKRTLFRRRTDQQERHRLSKPKPRWKKKRKQKKLNIDEAEEFFELISKAQSNRADDQRGLLNKSDLVLPDFLRLAPGTGPGDVPVSSTHDIHKPRLRSKENGSALSASHQTQSLDSGVEGPAGQRAFMPLHRNLALRKQATFGHTLLPVSHSHGEWKRQSGAQALEEDQEHGTDLTLVGEGDIAVPNSLLLPPSPLPLTRSPERPLLREDAYQDSWAQPGRERRKHKDKSSTSKLSQRRTPSAPPCAPPCSPPPAPPPAPKPASKPAPKTAPPPRIRGRTKRTALPSRQVLDVDGVCVENTRPPDEGINFSVLKQTVDGRNRRVRIKSGVRQNLPNKPLPVKAFQPANAPPSSESKHKATFV